MDKKELEQELKRLQDELEDVKQEKYFMLEKTQIHVPGHLKRQYEESISELEEKIKQIQEQLNEQAG